MPATPRDIDSLAKSLAAGKIFDMCATHAGGEGEDDHTAAATAEPPVYVSHGGLTVRVHRDGTTTPVLELDPEFRSRTSSSCHVACSSPSVQWADVTVHGVPPGIKFEARFHGGTLLHVEELSRYHSPSSDSSSSSAFSATGESKEDVRIRVHLPCQPVGLARVEAVWAEGPCRNLIAGAGFPLLLVPDEDTADELRTQFLVVGGGAAAAVSTSPEATRGFVQNVGYVLHAALMRDQGVGGHLNRLIGVAKALDLPLLCALATAALESLDIALENGNIDEMLAELDAAEVVDEFFDRAKEEKPAKHSIDQSPSPENVGVMKRWVRSAGAVAVPFARFASHYFLIVRPGILLTAIFCHFKAFDLKLYMASRAMRGEDNLKILIYVISTFLIDVIVIPDKVFAPLMKQQQQEEQKVQSVADLRRKVFLLQRQHHGGATAAADAAALKIFNEKLYKSALALSGTALLCLSSKPMINALLQTLVYEPQSVSGRLYWLACTYARVNMFSANYTKMDRGNMWMFVSLSAIPIMFYVFLFLIAVKHGDAYYTGGQPLPTEVQLCVQLAFWVFSYIFAVLFGNYLGGRRGALVRGGNDSKKTR